MLFLSSQFKRTEDEELDKMSVTANDCNEDIDIEDENDMDTEED